jgi:tetratricopeptide (TPR) repeat protein
MSSCPALLCLAVCLSSSALFAQQVAVASAKVREASTTPPVASGKTALVSPELRGDIFMARKMYREAIDSYRQGAAGSAVLTNKIGIAFHQLLQLELAKKYYLAAIKIDPHYSEAINNLGTIYYAQKSYGRAISCYKKSLKDSPGSASVYANLGAAYFARKDYKRASEYYEEALKIDPDVFEHHSGYGTIMQERTVGERATFHLYLAKTYAKSGANERALIYLRKALEEGVKDREKIPRMPEFAALKSDPAFKQLMAENPKPL